MSKSKNNGVDPQALIERHGADTVRLFIMFAAPPEQSLEWSESGVDGAARFLRRLWNAVHAHRESGAPAALDPTLFNDTERALRRQVHETVVKVSDDIGRRYTFNTAIAAVMELLNALGRSACESPQGQAIIREGLRVVVLLLSPIVPHICQALWEMLGGEGLIIDAAWPQSDEAALHRKQLNIVVQVNGKLRGHVTVPADANRASVERAALAEPNVRRFMGGKPARRVIVVPEKLVNVVV